MTAETCVCGHVTDEHRSGWGYDCLADGCNCDRFDHATAGNQPSVNLAASPEAWRLPAGARWHGPWRLTTFTQRGTPLPGTCLLLDDGTERTVRAWCRTFIGADREMHLRSVEL